jgi:hypothetical protein
MGKFSEHWLPTKLLDQVVAKGYWWYQNSIKYAVIVKRYKYDYCSKDIIHLQEVMDSDNYMHQLDFMISDEGFVYEIELNQGNERHPYQTFPSAYLAEKYLKFYPYQYQLDWDPNCLKSTSGALNVEYTREWLPDLLSEEIVAKAVLNFPNPLQNEAELVRQKYNYCSKDIFEIEKKFDPCKFKEFIDVKLSDEGILYFWKFFKKGLIEKSQTYSACFQAVQYPSDEIDKSRIDWLL